MLVKYLQAVLRRAKYEMLADGGSFYGEIAACNGVYASAATLEECREQLAEVLEEWLLLRVYKNLSLPGLTALSSRSRKSLSAPVWANQAARGVNRNVTS